MSKIPVVRINTEYVEQFMAKHEISGMEFSHSLGYSDSWWAGIKNETKAVKPNVARLICSLYKLDYEKLVVKAPDPGSEMETPDDTPERLARIEAKLDRLLKIWG